MSDLTTGGINFGYQSPISQIYKDVEYKFKEDMENKTMEAIHHFGISVDKEELIKALKYDRNQYDKGYSDGRESKEPVFFPPCVECNKKMDEVRRAYDNVQAGKNDIIEELEKIKVDIKKRLNSNKDFQLGILTAINVINYHISELKGENK